jgi:hypothetical protein
MDDADRLRLEYERAAELLRGLAETRFRLLALVPTVAGAVVAFVSAKSTGTELLAIGLLGLAATAGILLYELRNGQIANAAGARLAVLERQLLAGGPFVRPAHGPVSQTFGAALVYGAAIAGWVYLVAWGALRAAGMHSHTRSVGLVIGAAGGIAVTWTVLRLERDRPEPAPEPQSALR